MKTCTVLATLACLFVIAAAEEPATPEEAPPAPRAIVETIVEYRSGEVVLEGFLARPDDGQAGKVSRPGVLICHAWKGLGDHERESARKLADLGFIAFALDIYGKGVRPKDNAEAGKQAGAYKGDLPLLRARARAGLETLVATPGVDPTRIGVIGYCFGGTTALELARDGAAIAAVVSFHGGLGTKMPAAKGLAPSILVCHGAADPFVPAEEVAAFQAEMHAAGADWQMHSYGSAVHSFTEPAAGDDPSRGAAYNEPAARRSWSAMLTLFAEKL